MATKRNMTMGDIAQMKRDYDQIEAKIEAITQEYLRIKHTRDRMTWEGNWYPLPVLRLYTRVTLLSIKTRLLNRKIRAVKRRWS